ncbi:DUF3783 domain-containing protein [Romboutsia maritimum]|uniref:DUF3783 domain-containing protein n=1 Tax=Romboutsia maritimum TaxID=2020948 RepID=A0A371IVF6_9FIRM|nr:DUF3783 domain-containing protein [Romboutsia maritimum]RDY24456.1 DUF3783 domain-containing protein [Romboutsia maritimum]
MSFEKIKNINENKVYDRNCIMIVNFNKKESVLIKNISNLIGIKDHIFLQSNNGKSLIKDILSNEVLDDYEDGMKNKAIIFNNIEHARINSFLESLKKMRVNRPLTAVVTETSIDWTLDNLIKNLVEERNAIKKGKFVEHK